MLSSSFFVLLTTLSRQNYACFSSLEMNAIIETLMQCAEWYVCFAVNYFRISLISSKSTKLQLLAITRETLQRGSLHTVVASTGTITDVACRASTSEQGMVNTLRRPSIAV